jgi:hypothetical protein
MLWIRTHLRGLQYMFVIISNLWSQPISGSPNRCTAIWENEMWWSNSFIDADHVQYVLPLVSLPRVLNQSSYNLCLPLKSLLRRSACIIDQAIRSTYYAFRRFAAQSTWSSANEAMK